MATVKLSTVSLFVQLIAIVIVYVTGSQLWSESTEGHLDGPCIIRRTRLPRLDGNKVGNVQRMQLNLRGEPHLVKTLSLKPPIFEIPNFLSEDECDRLLKVTNQHKLHTSDIINPDMTLSDLDYDTSFKQWDRNSDGNIDKSEIFGELLYLRDLHFTDHDIKKMFKKLKLGRKRKGHILPEEFNGKDIMTYVDQLRLNDPKVKGRHSNETWLDTWEDIQLMRTLNKRKSALTGLPLQIIEGSETPVVVSYGRGGHYHCHYDSHSPTPGSPCCHRASTEGCRVCRYITILYFLNDVDNGGQTAFPIANNRTFNEKVWHRQSKYLSNLSSYCSRANLLVTPNKGTAIMWYNHVLNKRTGWIGGLDRMSYHGGCDVIKGEKMIMNNWINIVGEDFEDLRTWSDKDTRIVAYS